MADKKKKQRCYLYTRVSTVMQVDGYSLESQEERLRREAKHRGFEIVDIFSDGGKSGKNIAGRPEFQKMLDRIKEGSDDVDYVFVFKLSRFGRNTADTLSSLQFMQDYGVELLCVEDGIDSAGAAGKLMISVLAAVAEIERENILAQTMAGRWQKARNGLWNGAQAPLGYLLKDGKLVIDDEQADIIRLIYDKYINEGMSLNGIERWLFENGYRKRVYKNSTDDKYNSRYIGMVLDNPVYAGYIAYGRRKTEKIDGTRNEYHMVRQDKYEIFEGQHEAIIDRALWEKVRVKRAMTGGKREKKYSLDHAHILSSILKCPECGGPMYGTVNRKRKKGKNAKEGEMYTDIWYYFCPKSRKFKTCPNKKLVRQDVINEQVEIVLKHALKDVDFNIDISKKLGMQTSIADLEKDLKRLEKSRSKDEAKKSKLLSKIMALDPSDDMYDVLFDDLQKVVKELSANISTYDESIYKVELALANANGQKRSAETAYQVLKTMIDCIDMLPEEDEQLMMHFLVDAVELFDTVKPNGLWVKKVRLKVPINIGDEFYDEINVDENGFLTDERHDETVVLMSRKDK